MPFVTEVVDCLGHLAVRDVDLLRSNEVQSIVCHVGGRQITIELLNLSLLEKYLGRL